MVTHRTLTTLFFAGTDTEVGKTYTAALVARQLHQVGMKVGAYKPVASGCREIDGERIADDAVALWEAIGKRRSLQEVCPQCFLEPLAPPEAASVERKSVDAEQLRSGAAVWMEDSDVLIVEGAGGLFSPLADGVLNIDLAKQFADCKLIVVAANRLGVIHQTLSTCVAAKHSGLEPHGIILCDPTGVADQSTSTNPSQISRYSRVPLLGRVPAWWWSHRCGLHSEADQLMQLAMSCDTRVEPDCARFDFGMCSQGGSRCGISRSVLSARSPANRVARCWPRVVHSQPRSHRWSGPPGELHSRLPLR